jgi:hypothetical protein
MVTRHGVGGPPSLVAGRCPPVAGFEVLDPTFIEEARRCGERNLHQHNRAGHGGLPRRRARDDLRSFA